VHLRELARQPEMATARTLREVRCDDRLSLGRHHPHRPPENKASLGFVEGVNSKTRVLRRRAYWLHHQEYLRPKVLSISRRIGVLLREAPNLRPPIDPPFCAHAAFLTEIAKFDA
jgi:hypothetical protein